VSDRKQREIIAKNILNSLGLRSAQLAPAQIALLAQTQARELGPAVSAALAPILAQSQAPARFARPERSAGSERTSARNALPGNLQIPVPATFANLVRLGPSPVQERRAATRAVPPGRTALPETPPASPALLVNSPQPERQPAPPASRESSAPPPFPARALNALLDATVTPRRPQHVTSATRACTRAPTLAAAVYARAGNLRLKTDLHVKVVPLVRDPAPERAAAQTARRGSTVEHKQTRASRVRLEQYLDWALVSVCRAALLANILERVNRPAQPVLLVRSRSPERAAARTAQPERAAELRRGPVLLVQLERSAGEVSERSERAFENTRAMNPVKWLTDGYIHY